MCLFAHTCMCMYIHVCGCKCACMCNVCVHVNARVHMLVFYCVTYTVCTYYSRGNNYTLHHLAPHSVHSLPQTVGATHKHNTNKDKDRGTWPKHTSFTVWRADSTL